VAHRKTRANGANFVVNRHKTFINTLKSKYSIQTCLHSLILCWDGKRLIFTLQLYTLMGLKKIEICFSSESATFCHKWKISSEESVLVQISQPILTCAVAMFITLEDLLIVFSKYVANFISSSTQSESGKLEKSYIWFNFFCAWRPCVPLCHLKLLPQFGS